LGNSAWTDRRWTNAIATGPETTAYDAGCDYPHHVYCFGVGTGSQPGPPGAIPGEKLVFVTRDAFSSALGGLAGADRRCADDAADAGLSGTYRAYLGSGTAVPYTPPSTRSGTARWYRPDGLEVGDLSVTPWKNAPILTATGQRLPSEALVWTGAPTPNLGGDTCGNWTGNEQEGIAWRAADSAPGLLQYSNIDWIEFLPCTASARLLCFGK
jgi:hypothetical protein